MTSPFILTPRDIFPFLYLTFVIFVMEKSIWFWNIIKEIDSFFFFLFSFFLFFLFWKKSLLHDNQIRWIYKYTDTYIYIHTLFILHACFIKVAYPLQIDNNPFSFSIVILYGNGHVKVYWSQGWTSMEWKGKKRTTIQLFLLCLGLSYTWVVAVVSQNVTKLTIQIPADLFLIFLRNKH